MKLKLFILLLILSYQSKSQELSRFEKFGKITTSDLNLKYYKIDSGANAVILSDIGSAEIEGNSENSFSFKITRHKVVHILNKNGYAEAVVEIPLFIAKNAEEKIKKFKAVTYNLEGGKIEETKLEKSNEFSEKATKNHKIVKYTFPKVKEGSIIEYEYEVESPFYSIVDPWYFQSLTAPTLWSEFKFSIPTFFVYNVSAKGYQPFKYNEKKTRNGSFAISGMIDNYNARRGTLTTEVNDYRWVIVNSPELKTESFTSSVKNHINRIEFQLAMQTDPLPYKNYQITWEDATHDLLNSEYFGKDLKSNNGWMSDEIQPLVKDEKDKLNIAKKIFAYVRDNYKCNDKHGIYLGNSLKSVSKYKEGSIAEINLLLAGFLKYANITANPVLLSTRWNGYASEYSSMISSMNYVVVQVFIGDDAYYLDASKKFLAFNKLSPDCYNGYARVIDENSRPVYFNSDDYKEIKKTTVFINNLEEGKYAGAIIQNLGDAESYFVRQEISSKGNKNFFDVIRKKFESFADISSEEIDSLNNPESNIVIKYELNFKNNDEDIIYVNPTFGQGYTKNPFNSSIRNYPVEMPFTQDEIISVTMEIPQGYVVDELPKQTILNFDEEGKSFFEYRIVQSKNTINFYNRIKLNKAFFPIDDYEPLKEFFGFIVKKQAEQIVFKKMKQ